MRGSAGLGWLAGCSLGTVSHKSRLTNSCFFSNRQLLQVKVSLPPSTISSSTNDNKIGADLGTRWVPTNTCRSCTPKSSRTFSNSSRESDVGSTDSSPLSTGLLDLLDPTRLGDWVTRPSRVTLSTEFESGGETGRSLLPRVLPTVNPLGRVSTTSSSRGD